MHTRWAVRSKTEAASLSLGLGVWNTPRMDSYRFLKAAAVASSRAET